MSQTETCEGYQSPPHEVAAASGSRTRNVLVAGRIKTLCLWCFSRWRVEHPDQCYVCGCTERCACEAGCYWIEPNLCSSCARESTLIALSVEQFEAIIS